MAITVCGDLRLRCAIRGRRRRGGCLRHLVGQQLQHANPAAGRQCDPFTAAGAEAFRKNAAGLANGTIEDAARKYCVPDGVPRILATPYPFQIFESPGFVTIFYEQNHVFRSIPLDRPVATDEELAAYPYYSGNSFGHWEGDTLVVLTKGFNEKTFVDASGVPHSDRLRVTERLRKINGGKIAGRCCDDRGSRDVHAAVDSPVRL